MTLPVLAPVLSEDCEECGAVKGDLGCAECSLVAGIALAVWQRGHEAPTLH